MQNAVLMPVCPTQNAVQTAPEEGDMIRGARNHPVN